MENENKKVPGKHTLQDFVDKFNALSSVFESMPTGVFAILDQHLDIATINRAASEILGTDTISIKEKMHRISSRTSFPESKK